MISSVNLATRGAAVAVTFAAVFTAMTAFAQSQQPASPPPPAVSPGPSGGAHGMPMQGMQPGRQTQQEGQQQEHKGMQHGGQMQSPGAGGTTGGSNTDPGTQQHMGHQTTQEQGKEKQQEGQHGGHGTGASPQMGAPLSAPSPRK